MQKSKRIKAKSLLLQLVVCAASEVCLPWFSAAQLAASVMPQSPARALNMAGLRDRVTVRRDERGIPYIEASCDADLYLVQGYITASDRLWQMDLMRRTARGELAEIFGKVALEQDKVRRRYGFGILADEAMATLPHLVRSALESYARGVNTFIESNNGETLPPEFGVLNYKPQLWRPQDSILVGKLFFETLTTSWQVDLMRASLSDLPRRKYDDLLPERSPLDLILVGDDSTKVGRRNSPARNSKTLGAVDADLLVEAERLTNAMGDSLENVGLRADNVAASNNWAVSPKRSASGEAMLANDPHLPASAPSVWYMTHLSTPTLRVAGVTSPGLPGIIIGHNNRVAWGVTQLGADVQDLYVENFDKANPSLYQTPSGLREVKVRKEQIRVRKALTSQDSSLVDFDVTATRNGPILIERGASRYALRWTALAPRSSELEAFYLINRARDWNEFRAALSLYTGPPQNFVYADTDGHIGYQAAGQIPIRKEGDGSLPYEGATNAGDWVGYIPFSDLPRLYDPSSGVIVTANNRVVGTSYPYNITHNWAEPYRARRIHDLLVSKPKLTMDHFRAIQGDTYSMAGAILAKEVIKAAKSHGDAPEWREVLKIFESWDAMANAESRAMPFVAMMRRAIRRRLLIEAVGSARANEYIWGNSDTFLDWILLKRPPSWLPKEFDSYDSLLLTSYKDAREELKRRLGEDESGWTWGRFAQARFTHALASLPLFGQRYVLEPVPQNGAYEAVNVGARVSMRLVVDTSDWDKTLQGIALGQSGDPSSSHWKDQLESWRTVSPRAFPFTERKVPALAKEVCVLNPQAKR